MSLKEYESTHKQCILCDKLVPKSINQIDIHLETEHGVTNEKTRKVLSLYYFGSVKTW